MHIWIVETKRGERWEPCACANLTRKDAEREKAFYWEHNNPTDEFRVKKYIPGYQTPNAQIQGLPKAVPCNDGLGVAVPPAPTFGKEPK